MKQSGFNPCRECGVIPEVYAFGKVAKCPKCRKIQAGANFDELLHTWNNENPVMRYSKMSKMIAEIAETLKETHDLEKQIAAKILKEEKEGRD